MDSTVYFFKTAAGDQKICFYSKVCLEIFKIVFLQAEQNLLKVQHALNQ